MKPTFYHYQSIIAANDAANLYYINFAQARGMKKNPEQRQIEITGRAGTIIAVFTY